MQWFWHSWVSRCLSLAGDRKSPGAGYTDCAYVATMTIITYPTAARLTLTIIENGEARWQTIGIVEGFLVLLVAHTVNEDEDGTEVIRIISARRADRKERKSYEQSNR